MDIIFQGQLNTEEAAESLLTVLRLFKDRYSIAKFREMHLTVTLVDENGDEVELVDNETSRVYRTFEVYKKEKDYRLHEKSHQHLHLVVDNTR